MELYTIPPFFCPILPEVHADAGRHTQTIRTWLSECGLVVDKRHEAHLAHSEIERLVEWTVPHAKPDRLLMVILLNCWYHIADDILGDAHAAGWDATTTARVATSLQHVLESPESATTLIERPFATALADIARQVREKATSEQYAGWKAGVQSYLLFEVCEAVTRGQVPDLETYVVHCLDGRAARPSMLMLPIAGAYVVPSEEMDSPIIRAATEAACLQACLANDLYSFGKERFQEDHGYTLVRVLANERGCQVRDAIREAVVFHDVVMSRFVRLSEAALADPNFSPQARSYVRHLRSWVRGQIEWGVTSPRFIAPAYGVKVLPEAFTDIPSADDSAGAPADSLAWWWEVPTPAAITAAPAGSFGMR